MNPDNQDREINGIFSALEHFKAKEGYILTRDSRDEILKNGKRVCVLPAWEYFNSTPILHKLQVEAVATAPNS